MFRVWCVLAVLLGCLCYWNSLYGDLVHDDVFAIRDNQDLRPDTPLSTLFLDDFWGEPMSSRLSHKSYRPLTVLSFRLNYMLHGLQPWGYHLLNLLLHCLATLLFGWFCSKEVFRGVGLGSHCNGVAMLLFSSHPVHTEAVAGVVGRADVLASIFFLLSLMLYTASTRTSKLTSMLAKFLLSIVCACAAMLSKEHGATVLGVCLAYDILIANRNTIVRLYEGKASAISPIPLFLRVAVLLLATALLLVARVSLLHGHLPHFSAQDNPASFADSFVTRLGTYAYLVFFNLRLLFFPYTLSYDWQMNSIPLVDSFADPRQLLTITTFITLAALTCTALCRHGNSHAPLWGVLLLVVPFLPASNLLIRVGFVVAERILYISSFGWCILIAAGVHCMVQRWPHLSSLLTTSLLFLILLFAGRTVSRNKVWQSRETLFWSALTTVPGNAKVHFNYANFLKDSGRNEEAVEFYQRAIRLSPEHSISHNNLGSLLRGKEAEFHFRQAVLHNPQHFKAYYNLGRNLEGQARMGEAEEAYRKSLGIRPTYIDSLMTLSSLLSRETGGVAGKQGVGGAPSRAEESWQLMERALQQESSNPDVLNNAGTVLLRLGREPEAMSLYERALTLDPTHVTALTSLGRIHRRRGAASKAETLLRKSLSLHPDPYTCLSLAGLLHNTRRLEEAEQVFRQGLNLDPTVPDLLCGLMQTMLAADRFDDTQKMLDNALQAQPYSACVSQVAGTLALQQKQPKQAVQFLERALQLSNSSELSADILHLRGGACKDLGQLDMAEKDYRAALTLVPNRAATLMNLGALLHLKKDYTNARIAYETALKQDPHNSILKANLQKLERAAAQASRT